MSQKIKKQENELMTKGIIYLVPLILTQTITSCIQGKPHFYCSDYNMTACTVALFLVIEIIDKPKLKHQWIERYKNIRFGKFFKLIFLNMVVMTIMWFTSLISLKQLPYFIQWILLLAQSFPYTRALSSIIAMLIAKWIPKLEKYNEV